MKRKIIKWYLTAIGLTIAGSLLIASTVHGQEPVKVPEEVKEISEELGQAYDICPELIQAICCIESRFQADAVNADCIGIMQVSERWHKDRMKRLGVTDLTDAKQNMTVAVDYLAGMVKDGEDMEEALMRYHGESDIGRKLEEGEMSDYVEAVLSVSAMLEREEGK